MDQRGIMSVDLLFASLMMLIIIGYTATLASDRFDMVGESERLAEARNLAESIAGAINQAYAGGEGHCIRVKMPPSLGNDSTYRVQVNSSGVLVMPKSRKGLAYTVPKRISNIILNPSKEYLIMNMKDGGGENCIVITEV